MKKILFNQKALDREMQKGYTLLSQNNHKQAILTWQKVWNQIKRIMDKNEIQTIEELDEVFDGTESMDNWSTDFSQELLNMSRQKKDFLQNRLTFYTEYLERTADLSEDNAKTMKADLAQAYFEIGQAQKGEKLFQELTTDYPTWGWGWIFWSEVYGVSAEDTNKDFDRALYILNEALTVKGLEDKEDLMDRMEHTKLLMEKGTNLEEER